MSFAAPFAYVAPRSLSEAIGLMAAPGGRVLAGGQSLVPMLLRGEARARTVVDINRIPDLATVTDAGDHVIVGALVRQEQARVDPVIGRKVPLLAAALEWVANPGVRRRGTLVGNLVNAAPGGEAVAVAYAQGAEFLLALGDGGRMHARVPTALPEDAIALAAIIPGSPQGTRAGFYEVQRRYGHLGLVGAGVALEPNGAVRAVLSGATAAPLLLKAVARAIQETNADVDAITFALDEDLAGRTLRSDIHADADYRREVAPVVIARALQRAREARPS